MSFSTYRCLLMTIDPVHIGTGGMRLGRVDNSIVREPGTRLPKIPGTSLSGAIRSYAAYRYGKRTCAGKDGHCGRPTCPICYTFGSVKGEGSEQSYSGVVSIGDARLLLFPVYSMAGPVWVTSPSALADFGIGEQSVDGNKAKWNSKITSQKHLNLGWLMVEKDGADWSVPDGLKNNVPTPVSNRIVLISDKLFSQVVNSNLEVRTSVAINPETGAAEEGALFTYEAIPRAAFLWMDAVVDDFREAFPSKKMLDDWKKTLEGSGEQAKKKLVSEWHLWKKDNGDARLNDSIIKKALKWIEDDLEHYRKVTMPTPDGGWKNNLQNAEQDGPQYLISAALDWAEHLGIGGMGTRGFERMKVVYPTQSKTDAQREEGRANVS